MASKRRQRRIPATADTSDDDASDKGASDKVDQWVVAIVAKAQDDEGNAYFHVRWGTDDEGKPFDVGEEEETWEPWAHVQGCQLPWSSSQPSPLLRGAAGLARRTSPRRRRVGAAELGRGEPGYGWLERACASMYRR